MFGKRLLLLQLLPRLPSLLSHAPSLHRALSSPSRLLCSCSLPACPCQVRDYVKEFHPRMIGLTGPYERVGEAAKAYRVYFSKTQDSEDDYLVDHSIITYLINPEVWVGGVE